MEEGWNPFYYNEIYNLYPDLKKKNNNELQNN